MGVLPTENQFRQQSDPRLITVVIPAFNAQSSIINTVRAALNQTYPHVEVIVVNDGSTDQTQSVLESINGISLINQTNKGPAVARNAGARAANGDIICFTDSDCTPEPDWIEQLIKDFNKDEIGAVAGSYGLMNRNSRLARCIQSEILYRHHYLMPEFPKSFGSYNVAIRKEVFNLVGGFNGTYPQASGEDNDLAYKILNKGYRIYFNRNAIVNHLHPEKIMRYLREQWRHGFWRVKMYGDHPQMMKGDDYTFWKDIVEVPFSFLSVIFFLLMIFFHGKFTDSFMVIVSFFIFIELIFGFIYTKKIIDGIYYSFVMFFRSFARTFGFSSGIFSKFLIKS